MTTTQKVGRESFKSRALKLNFRVRMATLVMLSVVLLAGVIVVGWFAGERRINTIFEQINWLQQNPPIWLEAPMITGEYLIAPLVILFLAVWAITQISPYPKAWSRFIVVTLLLVMMGRYLVWRSLSTLDLNTPLNGVFSLGLLGMELIGLVGSLIQLILLLKVRDRRRQADQASVAVVEGQYTPKVDVFIPTYDEPAFILRRTIIGCQSITYPHKTIYLLDDTRRAEIRALAAELGCEYMTRPDNKHAKAGNLNHALSLTNGDLVASFDADFVPTRNFLQRTVGFFQDPQVALVQTPQSFYNPDPIARNLGLEDILTPEEEVFYRQIQPMRDGSGSVVCSGTSFVVRRSALEAAGGFVTESLSEDYFTSVRLAAQGNRVIYLDEKLSAGLAAENIAAHATQRLRWARGTLQAFFIDSNPLTIPGLTPWQRLGHLEGLLHWFSSIPQIFFLSMPLAYSLLGVIPIRATPEEVLYFFLPYYLVQLTVFAWLNNHSRSALLSNVYSLVLAFPLAFTVFQALLSPFSKGFKVTPKGTSSDRFIFNWNLAWPLVVMFVITAFTLWRNLGLCLALGWGEHLKGLGLGWIWSAHNLIIIGIALLILLDAPQPDPNVWFDLRRIVRLKLKQADGMPPEHTWWGYTTMISEVGAQIALTQGGMPVISPGEILPVELEIVEEQLKLEGKLIATRFEGEFPSVRIHFEHLNLSQQRCLVEILFCRPGQWRRWKTPGELQSLWILLRILFKPRALMRGENIKAMAVAKV